MAEQVQLQEQNNQNQNLNQNNNQNVKTEQNEVRILNLNIRKYVIKAPLTVRAKKAVKVLKELVKKYTKYENIKFSEKLNNYIWSRGIRNPPMKYKLKIEKKDNYYLVDLLNDNN